MITLSRCDDAGVRTALACLLKKSKSVLCLKGINTQRVACLWNFGKPVFTTYMSVVIHQVVGQFEFIKRHDLFHPLLSSTG